MATNGRSMNHSSNVSKPSTAAPASSSAGLWGGHRRGLSSVDSTNSGGATGKDVSMNAAVYRQHKRNKSSNYGQAKQATTPARDRRKQHPKAGMYLFPTADGQEPGAPVGSPRRADSDEDESKLQQRGRSGRSTSAAAGGGKGQHSRVSSGMMSSSTPMGAAAQDGMKIDMRFPMHQTERAFLLLHLNDERARLSGVAAAVLVVAVVSMVCELTTEAALRKRSDDTVIALRCALIGVCALALVYFARLVPKSRAQFLTRSFPQSVCAVVLALIGVVAAAHQAWVETVTENILSTLTYLLTMTIIGLQSRLCAHRLIFPIAASTIAYIILAIPRSSTNAVGGDGVVAMQILVVATHAALMTLNHVKQERRSRRSFVINQRIQRRLSSMRKDANVMKQEYFNLVLEKFSIGDQDEDMYDFEPPVVNAVNVLRGLMNNPSLTQAEVVGLHDVIATLSGELYAPALGEQVDQHGKTVDPEVRAWLQEVADIMKSDGKREQGLRKARSMTRLEAIGSTESSSNVVRGLKTTQSELQELLAGIDKWNFEIFHLCTLTKNRPLYAVGYTLFQRYRLIERFKINEQKLQNFLEAIESGYRDNPYHNSIHGADVAQTVHALLQMGGQDAMALQLTDLDHLAIIIASLVHDFEHPGLTNKFLIATHDELAILYNDYAVLEMHHIAATSRILLTDECNILEGLTDEEYAEVRKSMISMVLATDLAQHFDIVGKFQTKVKLDEVNIVESPEDRDMALRMLVKCGDVSHTSKKRDLHLEWTHRITNEFFQQGDTERARKMAISPFMDRETSNLSQSQVGFINFLIIPLFETIAQFMTWGGSDIELVVNTIKSNRDYWKSLGEEKVLQQKADKSGDAADAAADADEGKDSEDNKNSNTNDKDELPAPLPEPPARTPPPAHDAAPPVAADGEPRTPNPAVDADSNV